LKKLIVASTSTVFGSAYLEYLLPDLATLFKNTSEILFVPYARPTGITHDDYTSIAAKGFAKLKKRVVGLHTFENPAKALEEAGGIFVGGGNTFLLVTQLYKYKLMEPLRQVILTGTPYLGTSAGSNITGLTMQTTNDMPIVYPPSFKTLGILPFNINPHYLDSDAQSKHMGETRETRIKEFHSLNSQPVIGLREGSWLEVEGPEIRLKGTLSARIFEREKEPYELKSDSLIDIK